ncbi:MAG: NAD-dependent epimerase/dehydratase family protein [Candidatus Taylorbacteria bacterium]|nr:NAD-dependent epimerase/dehydratase family protein [Candidatus Taylorbacteria bacterium]
MQSKKIILVTGGAGFVGSNLIEQLVKDRGNEVYSLDNYSTGSKNNHIKGATYIEGDTSNIVKLVKVKPDLVFHLGEYARVEKSFEDIEMVWRSNKDGTFAVLEFCRTVGTKIVYAGSSTKFGDGGLGRDQSPYAWAKASNTELVKNYGIWFGLKYAITYFYNVYGPRELGNKFGTVIEIFRQQRLSGEPLKVVSPGTQTRIFTHVDDIVRGLILAGEKGSGDGYGLGAEEEYSILDIAKMFGGKIQMLPERAGNRMTASIDLSRSRDELGWHAEKSIKKYVLELVSNIKST